jgi:hypothetical protein
MVACHPAGRTHRLAQVRDRAAAPAADLVAKEAQPADEAAPDGAGGYHSATGLVGVRRRSDLDRVAIASQLDDEGRVVEIAPWAIPARGVEGLENATVEPDGRVTTRAQRNPIGISRSRLTLQNAPGRTRTCDPRLRRPRRRQRRNTITGTSSLQTPHIRTERAERFAWQRGWSFPRLGQDWATATSENLRARRRAPGEGWPTGPGRGPR